MNGSSHAANLSEEEAPTAKKATWRPTGMTWGVGLPWTLGASAAVRLWLLVAPTAFALGGPGADADYILGTLAIVFTALAIAEVGRPVRFLNVLVGAGLVVFAFAAPGSAGAHWNDVAAGVALALLAVPLGPIRERYGSFDGSIRWSPLASLRRRRHEKTLKQLHV